LTIDSIKENLIDAEKSLEFIQELFPIEKLLKEKQDLEKQQQEPNFFSDRKNAEKVGKRIAGIDKKLQLIKSLNSDFKSLKEILVDESEIDEEFLKEILIESKNLQKKCESLQIEGMFKGKYDANNAILSIQSGAGGTEACDWADMLLRMYKRYLQKQGYKFEVLDQTEGDGAGIKGVMMRVSGENAYGYLKAERGVHRLVRISPFDANKRRHTSFASVEVMPEIDNETDIIIRPEDLKIDVFRSGGHGGQGVNTTDSAVRIKHIPTGIVVQCQNERSQIQNKENALSVLRGKLAQIEEEKQQKQLDSIQGKLKKIEWGSQIRSYVFCPYTMVKDHRTEWETSDIQGFMDGDMQDCIETYLKMSS